MPKAVAQKRDSKKSRAPTGVLSRTPVALRLLPEELERLKDHASKELRTDAAFARMCFLYGLKAYERGRSLLA